ncbi:amidohydrolase family protein [Rariglobus hedericola]|uniref:Amidohydrolase family protein n=1 Tax=Rariglobus hedericola TaxID=2597822 RepID=A0A556QMQ2_9BACT|nr:amidohydrolase family protein [Rariglobus hedericola]TSJ77926.1 amidohydrolase family protein [Rariglobus hedericola]
MPEIRDCIVLHGPDLAPHRCHRFAWETDTITALDLGEPCRQIDNGALVIIPGLYNGHTHMGDSALPDGATGLTLEEAFFRPAGYKYRELAKLSEETHLPHLVAHLGYMARTGVIAHLDFREQGAYGARLLRKASEATGVESIILNQFDSPPFTAADLDANTAPLPASARAELDAMLAVADGFSESTMNDLTDVAWREIRTATSAAKKIRAIHCLESAGYRDRSHAITGRGDLIRAIEVYDADLIVHLTVANSDEIALLARSGKTAAINPRANASLGLPLPPVAALLRAGVNLLLGTDNGMLNSPSLLPELDFTYKLAKSQFGDALSPDPSAILKMATSNIRPLLGGDHYGYLERGLPADFVVLDFHAPHLRATRHIIASVLTRVTPADVLGTYRQGRELWRDPRWP